MATIADIKADLDNIKQGVDRIAQLVADLKNRPTLPDGSVAVPQADLDALDQAAKDIQSEEAGI